MFSKNQDDDASRSTRAVPSILSSDLKFTGDIASDGEVQIDGDTIGDIKCRKLVIGGSGFVQGSIVAEEVVINGRVEGEIRAASVKLAETARVSGDILHESLQITFGAHVEGHCRRLDNVVPANVEAEITLASTSGPVTDDPETLNEAHG